MLAVVALACAVMLFACSDSDSEPAAVVTGQPSATAAPVEGDLALWQRFEATIDAPLTSNNPFDPAQADLTAEFVAPSGETLRTPAFVTRDYTRALSDGYESITPQGELYWKVRFTPTEAGAWRWRWTLLSPDGEQSGDWQDFTVGSQPAEGSRGFLRRSPDDDRYLRFDDGAPYFAVGENVGWYDDRGTFAYDAWFQRLADAGANYVRLWMPSWAFGIEWLERDENGAVTANTLGNYEARLDRAWQLDYVLGLAERYGIYIELSIQNHGPFSLTANSEWEDNPYNAANGGPLAAPKEVFTNGEARELFKRRLRYIVARWGYSPNILAWELWNEADLVEQPPVEDLLAWHKDMAGELRALDPYDHLVSTSTGIEWSEAALAGDDLASREPPYADLWSLPEIDFTQAHLYAVGGVDMDFTEVIPGIGASLRRFDKPSLIAEVGVDFLGPDEAVTADDTGAGFHDYLWAGLFAESFGTGMTWWWDNVIDPQDWYFHFGALSAFVEGVAFDREGFRGGGASASAAGRDLRAFSLVGDETALVWVKNAGHQWYAPDETTVADARLDLPGLGEGAWQATWLDTYTGEIVAEAEVDVTDGEPAVLDVPAFARDIALRLERRP